MLNRVATYFVLKFVDTTRCGMLHRSDGQNSASVISGGRCEALADSYRLLTHRQANRLHADLASFEKLRMGANFGGAKKCPSS